MLKKCIMYAFKQIKINICWNFVHKVLIYIFFIYFICKTRYYNVHIVNLIRITNSVVYEIAKI